MTNNELSRACAVARSNTLAASQSFVSLHFCVEPLHSLLMWAIPHHPAFVQILCFALNRCLVVLCIGPHSIASSLVVVLY